MSILDCLDKWGWFELSELFEVKKGKRLVKENMSEGRVPFVGSIDSNNGYREFIGGKPIHSGNTITVTYNGSVAEAFYQPKPFWASDDVNVLYPKFTLTPYIALFITAVIRREKYRFNYGRKWHVKRMAASKIKLPIRSNFAPDWGGIEKFMKSSEIVGKYDLVNVASMRKPLNKSNLRIEITGWKRFQYQELFDIERGRGPRKQELDGTGTITVVTSTDSNNGWTGFTSYSANHSGNTIGVNRNGSVGDSFYQPIPFCSTEDVHIFTPKFNLNKYIGLFIVTILKKEKYRYSYGRKWGLKRMKESVIKLPVDINGNPDWQFMEDYIKSLPFSKSI